MATQIMDTQGQDNACDPRPTSQALLSLRQGEEDLAPAVEAGSQLTDEEEPFLPVSMPVSSSGYVTFGYERALRNRIPETKISRHGEYSARAYTPTFVHDCLMLPGSLANVLGKVQHDLAEKEVKHVTNRRFQGFSRRHSPANDTSSASRLLRSCSQRDSRTVHPPITRLT